MHGESCKNRAHKQWFAYCGLKLVFHVKCLISCNTMKVISTCKYVWCFLRNISSSIFTVSSFITSKYFWTQSQYS